MAAVAVFMMIAVAFTPIVALTADDEDSVAATSSVVSDVEIQMFTTTSTDYSDLIYCSNSTSTLPSTVDATEWVQLGSSGVWININENSSRYGTFLRYGDTGMTNAEILAQATAGSTTGWLPLIQVSFKYTEAFTAKITVAGPTSSASGTYTEDMTMVKAGVTFDEVEGIITYKLLTDNVSPCLGYAALTDCVGSYSVKMLVDDSIIAEKTLTYAASADMITISGLVNDKSLTPVAVAGAVVAYTVNGVSKTVETSLTGAYTFTVTKGSVVAITGITYANSAYTFSAAYNYGTVMTTPSSKTFSANEMTSVVTVTDLSGKAVVGATVSAVWYNQTSTFVITQVTGKAQAIGTTDSEGKVKIAYVAPTVTDTLYLYVKASNTTMYTFLTNTIATGTNITEQITGNSGNAVSATFDSFSLKAKESSITVTVRSLNDENITGATVVAQWYSQVLNSGTTTYTVSAYSTNVRAAVSGVTNSGLVTVAYIAPTGTDATYFLYVGASGASPYTFDTVAVTTGSAVSAISTQLSGKIGCIALPLPLDDTILEAKENAYPVTGSVKVETVGLAGTTITYTNGVGSSTITNGSGTYTFYALEGSSPVVTATLTNYVFAPTSYTVATLAAAATVPDFAATSTATKTVFVTPVVVGSYTVGELADDTVVTFVYTVNGESYKTNVTVSGYEATLVAQGVAGSGVFNVVSATADHYAIDVTGLYGVADALITLNIWTHSGALDHDVEPGTITALPMVGGVTLVLKTLDNETLYTVTTNANGFAQLEIPMSVLMTVYDLDGDDDFNAAIYINNILVEARDVNFAFLDEANYSAAIYIDLYGEDGNDSDKYLTEDSVVSIAYLTFNEDADHPLMASRDVVINNGVIAVETVAVSGYEFVGWYVNGTCVSSALSANLAVDDGDEVVAMYSEKAVDVAEPGIDNTVLILCIIAVIIALIAVVYAVIAKKKE